MKADTADPGAAGRGEAWREDALPRGADLPAPPAEVHLVGAGGAGMRGLAVLLGGAGYRVSGCDRSADARAPELTEAGGRLRVGHDPAHVGGAALVVHSSAVPADHPELEAARRRGVEVWKRARALGALVNDGSVAAVAGTHGKTTITAMAAVAGRAAGLDPTAVVGGEVRQWGTHAVRGDGPSLVEADEYDRSFLALDPDLVLVSSVEPEHLGSYGDAEALTDAFRRFAARAADRRGVLHCVDDAGARRLGRRLGADGYGFGEDAVFRVEELPAPAAGAPARARLDAPGGAVEFRLAARGRHNLQNAAGALALVIRLGGDPTALADALAEFRGVSRRLEELVDAGGVAVLDDYAHHPTELRASMSAARAVWPDRELVAVFQPHLYTRTRRLAAEFAAALEEADEALVLPVYGAREDPIPGVDAGTVADASDGLRRVDRERARERAKEAGPGTVLLFMGAGDVTGLAREVAGEVRRRAMGA